MAHPSKYAEKIARELGIPISELNNVVIEKGRSVGMSTTIRDNLVALSIIDTRIKRVHEIYLLKRGIKQ